MTKGAKSIAEYKIRKWIETEIPFVELKSFEMSGDEAVITDTAGGKMTLVYDDFQKMVYEK